MTRANTVTSRKRRKIRRENLQKSRRHRLGHENETNSFFLNVHSKRENNGADPRHRTSAPHSLKSPLRTETELKRAPAVQLWSKHPSYKTGALENSLKRERESSLLSGPHWQGEKGVGIVAKRAITMVSTRVCACDTKTWGFSSLYNRIGCFSFCASPF